MSSLSDILTAAKNIVTALNQLGQTYLSVEGAQQLADITTATLVMTGQGILVADYKTDREVPATADACNPEYLMQLATYREALRRAEPGRAMRFCLVYTEAPKLIMVPDALLDRMAALRQPRP